MKYMILSVLLSFPIINGFSQNIQLEEWNIEEKLYIDERNICLTKSGVFLDTEEGLISLEQVFLDEFGYYVMSSQSCEKKMFKCVCNECRFEWEGGVFTIRCPNCGSKNFRVVLNR